VIVRLFPHVTLLSLVLGLRAGHLGRLARQLGRLSTVRDLTDLSRQLGRLSTVRDLTDLSRQLGRLSTVRDLTDLSRLIAPSGLPSRPGALSSFLAS